MTPAELKAATLAKLKVVPAGSTASAEDNTTIGDYYTRLHAMLVAKGLVEWALTEDIPERCAYPVMCMLAAMAADEFGVPDGRATELKIEGLLDMSPVSLAERQLRKALARPYVTHPVVSEYY